MLNANVEHSMRKLWRGKELEARDQDIKIVTVYCLSGVSLR